MAAVNEIDHRTAAESYTNVSELNEWRRVKVDPMLDNHQKLLIDGTASQPPIVLSMGLLHGKFDTMIKIGLGVLKLGGIIVILITLFGTIISIFEIGGPWIRQKLGLPASLIQPIHVSEYKPPPEIASY
jgi:hypothetical protein